MSKVHVGILRGGPSHQYDMSIESGATLLRQIRTGLNSGLNYNRGLSRHNYVASDVFIDKSGVWHVDGVPRKPADVASQFDVLWNALHGEYGEDGKVQNILDQSMANYTGSSAYTSAQVFNKIAFRNAIKSLSPEMAADMFGETSVKFPMQKLLKISVTDNFEVIAAEIFKTFPMPAVIKPQSGGNSIGVYVATDYAGLVRAFREIVNFTNDVLIEEYISGTEIVSGFVEGLRGEKTYMLIPVEVIPESKKIAVANSKIWSGHLDTISKSIGKYEIKMVPHLSEEHRSSISKIVTGIKNLLGIKHYATFDFIVSPRRGLYLIEADTHPHLTEYSPLLTSLKYGGIRTSDFIKHVLDEVSGRK